MPAKKNSVKKSAAPKAAKPKGPKPIGVVTHFYGHISVAIVKFSKPVKAGTMAHFKGATTDFKEPLSSMQYDHKPIDAAPKGKEVGVKVSQKVREGDEVFAVES